MNFDILFEQLRLANTTSGAHRPPVLGPNGEDQPPSTAAAIHGLTRAISVSRASRVRWWYQAERAWWRRRQLSQCPAAPAGGGWASRRAVSGTVSGIIPG